MMNNKNTAKKMSINENAILEKYLNTLATPISKHKPDKKLSFIWANDAFYKMTGHEKKDFKMVLSKILCKWKQDSVVSLFLYLDSVFKYKHKLVHNQSPV